MKMTPAFIVASLVCATPFALAVHQDLTRKAPAHDDDDYGFDRDYDHDNDDYSYDRDDPPDYGEIEPAYKSREVKADDLDQLFGAGPASHGPVLADLTIGSSSLNFQSDASRERIQAFKADKDVTIDFDFDEVSLNAIDVTVEGDEEELRAALVDRWGTPRRGGEDELVWLGPDQTRAVYSSRYDGFVLRFEKYATVDEIIAPSDKTKFGFEPFAFVGAAYDKVETAMGSKFQPSDDTEGDGAFVLPGVGAGAGKTMVRVSTQGEGAKIKVMYVEIATYDVEAVREALVTKFGKPKAESDDVIEWRKNGASITAEFYGEGLSILLQK